MLFTAAWRCEAEPIFRAIRQHSFVQGIASGALPQQTLIHYVQQDTQYLRIYGKVYGLALAKAQTPQQMRVFYDRLGPLLDGELIPHKNLCRVAGIAYEEVMHESVEQAPTAHHYANHMLSVASLGTLGEILAVLLPCHWVYVDIGKFLMQAVNHSTDHPFYDWMAFYASDGMQAGLDELTEILDHVAMDVGEYERRGMRQAFLDGCRLEYKFFDMAYRVEVWPAASDGAGSEPGESHD